MFVKQNSMFYTVYVMLLPFCIEQIGWRFRLPSASSFHQLANSSISKIIQNLPTLAFRFKVTTTTRPLPLARVVNYTRRVMLQIVA